MTIVPAPAKAPPQIQNPLAKRGYTAIVRAPGCDIEKLRDGSWHVLGGSLPSRPNEYHPVDESILPYLLGMGGDLVVYRLPTGPDEEAKPILSKGGMDGRPPSLSSVTPFDPGLSESIAALRDEQARRDREARKAKARPRTSAIDRRTAAFVAAVVVALFGAGTWTIANPPPAAPKVETPEMLAQRKGAVSFTTRNPDNPELMDAWQLYPSPDGSERKVFVGTFRKKDWEAMGEPKLQSLVDWRKDWKGARKID